MYNETIYHYEIYAKISNIPIYLFIWSMSRHVNLRSTKIGCPMLWNNSCSKWHKNQSKLSLFLWPPFDTCTLFLFKKFKTNVHLILCIIGYTLIIVLKINIFYQVLYKKLLANRLVTIIICYFWPKYCK